MKKSKAKCARDPTGFCVVEQGHHRQLAYIFSGTEIKPEPTKVSMVEFENVAFCPFIGEQLKLNI
ncbi:hypothetical protein M2140_000090 [Clostridiales Family XIII bacterium PM5-7]